MNMYPSLIIVVSFFNSAVMGHCDRLNDFCYNVQLLHNQCRDVSELPSANHSSGVRGKAGPKGEKGSPAILNEERLQAAVLQSMKGILAQVENKSNQCKNMIDVQATELSIIRQDVIRLVGEDCSQVDPKSFKSGSETSGVFGVYVSGRKTEVYCDLETDGGKWTVIQRRMDGSVDFFRNYSDYVEGFGNLSGEFWIGLNNIHNFVAGKTFELRIELSDWEGTSKYAKYSRFSIGDGLQGYELNVSGYSGTASDSFVFHDGAQFSTKDHGDGSGCARNFRGAWWYKGCHVSNLNGVYFNGGAIKSYADGIIWHSWKGYHYSMKFVEIKIRPVA